MAEPAGSVFEVRIKGLPPAKSGRSIFGTGRQEHHRRLRLLLEEVHRVKSAAGFRGFGSQPLRLDVEVHAPAAHVPGDATNYLGGIADALEIKKTRIKASGPLEHLDYRQHVGLYGNDRQLKEIHYREVVDEHCAYIVRLQPIH